MEGAITQIGRQANAQNWGVLKFCGNHNAVVARCSGFLFFDFKGFRVLLFRVAGYHENNLIALLDRGFGAAVEMKGILCVGGWVQHDTHAFYRNQIGNYASEFNEILTVGLNCSRVLRRRGGDRTGVAGEIRVEKSVEQKSEGKNDFHVVRVFSGEKWRSTASQK